MDYGYVYRVTNIENGKTYIGRHKWRAGEPWDRYLGSGIFISSAVAKEGREKFHKELISSHQDESSLKHAEEQAIIDEIASGGAEYNIYFSPKSRSGLPTSSLDAEVICSEYIDGLMSLDDIASRHSVSRNLIRRTLTENNVKLRSREETTKLRTAKSRQAYCAVCGNSFVKVSSRTQTCSRKCRGKLSSQTSILSNGSGKRVSDETKRKIAKSALGNKRAVGNKGSYVSAHIRWHVKRNRTSADCEYCTPS